MPACGSQRPAPKPDRARQEGLEGEEEPAADADDDVTPNMARPYWPIEMLRPVFRKPQPQLVGPRHEALHQHVERGVFVAFDRARLGTLLNRDGGAHGAVAHAGHPLLVTASAVVGRDVEDHDEDRRHQQRAEHDGYFETAESAAAVDHHRGSPSGLCRGRNTRPFPRIAAAGPWIRYVPMSLPPASSPLYL